MGVVPPSDRPKLSAADETALDTLMHAFMAFLEFASGSTIPEPSFGSAWDSWSGFSEENKERSDLFLGVPPENVQNCFLEQLKTFTCGCASGTPIAIEGFLPPLLEQVAFAAPFAKWAAFKRFRRGDLRAVNGVELFPYPNKDGKYGQIVEWGCYDVAPSNGVASEHAAKRSAQLASVTEVNLHELQAKCATTFNSLSLLLRLTFSSRGWLAYVSDGCCAALIVVLLALCALAECWSQLLLFHARPALVALCAPLVIGIVSLLVTLIGMRQEMKACVKKLRGGFLCVMRWPPPPPQGVNGRSFEWPLVLSLWQRLQAQAHCCKGVREIFYSCHARKRVPFCATGTIEQTSKLWGRLIGKVSGWEKKPEVALDAEMRLLLYPRKNGHEKEWKDMRLMPMETLDQALVWASGGSLVLLRVRLLWVPLICFTLWATYDLRWMTKASTDWKEHINCPLLIDAQTSKIVGYSIEKRASFPTRVTFELYDGKNPVKLPAFVSTNGITQITLISYSAFLRRPFLIWQLPPRHDTGSWQDLLP